MTDWCILRCSGTSTLRLADSLTDAGLEAWTPVTREIRRPTGQRTREEVAVPLMSGYVFARSTHLHALLALSRSPVPQYQVWDSDQRRMVTKGHPWFRLFSAVRFVPDRELEPLRRLERKPRPQRIERTFAIGERVRTDEAGFIGLTGTVTGVNGKIVTVAFGTWRLEPTFPSWALRPLDESTSSVHVTGERPECDAAKAA